MTQRNTTFEERCMTHMTWCIDVVCISFSEWVHWRSVSLACKRSAWLASLANPQCDQEAPLQPQSRGCFGLQTALMQLGGKQAWTG